AALLLPAIAKAKEKAKIGQAKTEMKNLEAAIKAYEGEYSRFPAKKDDETASNPDYTFGLGTLGTTGVENSNVVQIVMDVDAPANAGHARNRRNHQFFHAKLVSGDRPGVSTDDYAFRDPWGKPYIISFDMDGDDLTIDNVYGKIGGPGLTAHPKIP